jgi:hypothetical protein
MSRSHDAREQQAGTTLWRIIGRRFLTLAMLGVAMEWAGPVVSSDILLAPMQCAATNGPCYDVRVTAPHAPSDGSGRTSSTSCTSK